MDSGDHRDNKHWSHRTHILYNENWSLVMRPEGCHIHTTFPHFMSLCNDYHLNMSMTFGFIYAASNFSNVPMNALIVNKTSFARINQEAIIKN